jgi:hypothetical protein
VRLEAGDTGLTNAAVALRNLRPDGKQTALLDAVDHCFGLLRGYPERIKRLVILTDGADTISAKYDTVSISFRSSVYHSSIFFND